MTMENIQMGCPTSYKNLFLLMIKTYKKPPAAVGHRRLFGNKPNLNSVWSADTFFSASA